MSTIQVQNLFKASGCEVRTDTLTRQLYATDASIYQIEPRAVAFPQSPDQTAAVIQGALAANKGATTPCETKYDAQYELTVTVDLATGSVTFEGGGVTVNAKLDRPMNRITHVGYCLKDTIVDFSPIEASADR